ncbi:hypothetical protein Tco_0117882 [Tanacetum coccineum]
MMSGNHNIFLKEGGRPLIEHGKDDPYPQYVKQQEDWTAEKNIQEGSSRTNEKIEEMLKAGKPSHLIKELKQNNRKDQEKAAKKEDGTEGPMIIKAEMEGNFFPTALMDGAPPRNPV